MRRGGAADGCVSRCSVAEVRRAHVGRAELFNLLINPLNHDFALRWHRDDVRENATAEEEREALAAWSHGVPRSPMAHFDR